MNALKKVKRRFSIKDKHDCEPDYSADEADEETNQHLQKEIEEAEKHGYDQGKPGSFLNMLIVYGNRKTEEQLAREAREREQRYESKDGVIR